MIAKKLYFVEGKIADPDIFKEDMLEIVRLYGLDVVDRTTYGCCIEIGLMEGILKSRELLEKEAEYQATVQSLVPDTDGMTISEIIEQSKQVTESYGESTETIERSTGLKRDPETQCVDIIQLRAVLAQYGADLRLSRKHVGK